MSGGKKNPDLLFYQARLKKIKKEKEGMTAYVDKEHYGRCIYFLENLNLISITDNGSSITLTPDEVEAMYFKLRSYGWI